MGVLKLNSLPVTLYYKMPAQIGLHFEIRKMLNILVYLIIIALEVCVDYSLREKGHWQTFIFKKMTKM